MNDPRNGILYQCWIQSTDAAIFTLKNVFLLYVAGKYQCVYDVM